MFASPRDPGTLDNPPLAGCRDIFRAKDRHSTSFPRVQNPTQSAPVCASTQQTLPPTGPPTPWPESRYNHHGRLKTSSPVHPPHESLPRIRQDNPPIADLVAEQCNPPGND